MKRMKLLATAFLALGLAGLLTTVSQAQGDTQKTTGQTETTQKPKQKAGKRVDLDKLTKDLNLTSDQVEKIKTILKDQKGKAKELKNLPADERKTKVKEQRDEIQSKIADVLTDEQKAKFKDMHKKNKKKDKKPAL